MQKGTPSANTSVLMMIKQKLDSAGIIEKNGISLMTP